MLKKIVNYFIVVLVFLLPLFFLPFMTDFYGMPKNFLLIFAGVTLFCLLLAEKILSRDLKFFSSLFDLPVILFCATTIISTLVSSPNKIESLLLPMGTGTIIALTLLYFVIRMTGLHPVKGATLTNSLIASATILALLALYQFSGVSETIVPFDFMKPKFWTPTGSLLSLATFLVVALVIGVTRLSPREHLGGEAKLSSENPEGEQAPYGAGTSEVVQSSRTTRFLLLAAIAIILLGLSTTVYQLLTTQRQAFLPLPTGWAIAVEGFKNLKTSLFGVGPGNFVTAFTRFKPIGFNNNTQLWNFRFGSSSNLYLQLLTETGLLGLAAYLLIAYKILTTKSSSPALLRALQAILIINLILPSNLLLLFAFFVLLGLNAASQNKEKEGLIEYYSKTPLEQLEKNLQSKSLILVPVLLEILFLFFFVPAVWAEVLYKNALDKLIQGRGGDAYNLLIEAIKKNPYKENFRLSYSQINLALANNWAANPPTRLPGGQAGELTDQDRETITQLVSQAIREGKAATTLNPLQVANWENLAQIYRALINFAQGADAWAVAAYNQAISLDPLNPLLRLDLGGVFYAYGNYEQAEKLFEQAANLKPDWANARYNLAASLREQEKFVGALRELKVALSLVEPESNDFEKVSAEIEGLRAKMSPETPTASPSGELETLTPPEEAPEGIKPPLELGEETEPALPAGRQEITPSPSPTPTP